MSVDYKINKRDKLKSTFSHIARPLVRAGYMGGPKGYYFFYLNEFVHNRHKVGWMKFSKMNNIESPPDKVIEPFRDSELAASFNQPLIPTPVPLLTKEGCPTGGVVLSTTSLLHYSI